MWGAALVWASGAAAQVGEHGDVTTRSDVKVSIEGVPGTRGKKLDAFASSLGASLGKVKQCYAELVKKRPEVVGTLTVELTLPDKGKLAVGTPDVAPTLTPMRACVDKAFAQLDVSAVPRPAGVRVLLALTNSAAPSVDEVRKQGESAARVEVGEGPAGTFHARGGSTQGEVSFEVRGRARESVEQLHGLVRTALPGLFDCRRRAAKKDSPEGDIALKLDGRAITVGKSTVANERAPVCVSGVLKRALGARKPSGEVTIHFAEQGVRE